MWLLYPFSTWGATDVTTVTTREPSVVDFVNVVPVIVACAFYAFTMIFTDLSHDARVVGTFTTLTLALLLLRS